MKAHIQRNKVLDMKIGTSATTCSRVLRVKNGEASDTCSRIIGENKKNAALDQYVNVWSN